MPLLVLGVTLIIGLVCSLMFAGVFSCLDQNFCNNFCFLIVKWAHHVVSFSFYFFYGLYLYIWDCVTFIVCFFLSLNGFRHKRRQESKKTFVHCDGRLHLICRWFFHWEINYSISWLGLMIFLVCSLTLLSFPLFWFGDFSQSPFFLAVFWSGVLSFI